jgi:hypothetical protein
MKPKEKKPVTVCRIVNKKTGDVEKYKIQKFKVTYELIEDDCDIEEDSKESYKEDLKRFDL